MPVRPRAAASRRGLLLERQIDPMACGFACAVMLAADRGIRLDQASLVAKWRPDGSLKSPILEGLSPEGLAHLLSTETGTRWRGGDTSEQEARQVLAALAGRSWAALLGRGRVRHWVVIEARARDQPVRLRDPRGLRAVHSLGAFAEIWYSQEAVFEV